MANGTADVQLFSGLACEAFVVRRGPHWRQSASQARPLNRLHSYLARRYNTAMTPGAVPMKPNWKRRGKRLLKLAVAVYLGLGIVMFFLQNQIIFPGAATQGRAEAHVNVLPGEELLHLPTP